MRVVISLIGCIVETLGLARTSSDDEEEKRNGVKRMEGTARRYDKRKKRKELEEGKRKIKNKKEMEKKGGKRKEKRKRFGEMV